MTKADQKVAMTFVGTIAVVMIVNWLKSQPNCDRGCQTQLQHLENHVIKTGLVTLFPALRPFIG